MKDEIMQTFRESADLKVRFIRQNAEVLGQAVGMVVEAFKAGNKVLLFGNGGSAADAQHIAAEFVNRYQIERPPLPAIALTTDTSILTSISNDYGYIDSFSKQVKALGREGDVAIGISTSGTAANVIKAIKAAKEMGLKTISLTGGDGGDLAKLTDIALVVDSPITPRIQEVHITIGHVLCEMVDRMLFQKPT
ncbi:MAG: D-sedoheptulose 7-phosphate isomerase [Deltaproteobacteria bacterium]|jgi:D-sedoheptulose 7-phosphate isomerase|nr:D-sedoheptulose 7-phosphate isomerase [Deltaproteobacteria bacterium]MDO9209866.1 D-sedoheptulose 7-phosphate isomerase [Deltaproteobacteria bacterium]